MANSLQPGPSGLQYVNSPFGDTTWTKVFVGGLAWETRSETMRRYFEQFGEILEAVVITDKNTGRSKGYGFVTFRDPESASRACANPSPVIDGRRANCNLASLGRPQPAVTFEQMRSPVPYPGGVPTARGSYIGNFDYQQPFMYGYQQGFMYPQYGYAAYSPEYAYTQVVPPHGSQQSLQFYGVPGTVNSTVYPYNQLNKGFLGTHGFAALPGYLMPGQHMVHFGGPSVNAMTSTSVPNTPAPYPTGVATPIPQPPQLILPMHPPHMMQGSGSNQNAG